MSVMAGRVYGRAVTLPDGEVLIWGSARVDARRVREGHAWGEGEMGLEI